MTAAHDARRPFAIRRGEALGLGALLLVGWAPALLDAGAVAEAAALWPLAESRTPYVQPDRAFLLYVRFPLVALSGCLLLLSPGLVLARVLGRAATVDRLVLDGLALSLLSLGSVMSALTAFGISPVGTGFALVPAALSLVILSLAAVRQPPEPSTSPWGDWRVLATYLVPAFVLLATLAPKFLWESFNGDGAHAFEASRLLLDRPLPFFAPESGPISRFPGLTTMLFAFPGSWCIRLFGEVEAAVRIPFVPALCALYGGLCSLVRARPERAASGPLPEATRWLIWVGLSLYALTMAYSATYNPYHADIAMPGAQDTLYLALFVGFVRSFIRTEWPETVIFLGLSALTLPSWLLLVALWLGAVVLVWRPVPWRRVAGTAGLCVLVAVGFAVAPALLSSLGLPVAGAEHATGELLDRLTVLRLTDWSRWLYLALPTGILPAVYLFAWKRQDSVARSLTLVSAGYFLFFYVQAFVSLHHFLPAAVLPLAALWRDPGRGRTRGGLRAAALAASVVALPLVLPAFGGVHLQARRVGYAVEDRREGYGEVEPSIFASAALYRELFGRIVAEGVPERRYAGSPLTWNYYANHRPPGFEGGAYLFLEADAAAPPGVVPVGQEAGHALYVMDLETLRRHRSFREPASIGRLLAIPRSVLFRRVGGSSEDVIHLPQLLQLPRGEP